MEKMLLKDKYPIMKTEWLKDELIEDTTIDFIVKAFVDKISEKAKLIDVFDHYEWSKEVEDEAKFYNGMKAAKIIIFCGGADITIPEMLAVKPRNIGIVELEDRYVITMLEVPNPEKGKMWNTFILNLKEKFSK